MNPGRHILIIAGMVLYCAASVDAVAQTVTGGRSGTIRDADRPEPMPKSQPRSVPDVALDEAPQESANDVSFELRRIRFDGVTIFGPTELEALAAAVVGKDATLSDVRRVARELTQLYANKGYGFSFAYAPEQTITDGVVRITAIEARLGKIEVRTSGKGVFVGQAALQRLAEARLAHLRGTGPLSSGALERALLLLNDLGGISARVTLVPASASNSASDLIVTIDADPAQARLTIDNRLRPEFGRYTASLGVTLNSVLLAGDTLAASSRTGLDHAALKSVSATYSVPFGGQGLMVSLGGSLARTRARTGLLAALDFRGSEAGWNMGLSYPLIRSRSRNLSLDAAFEAVNSQSALLGSIQVRDRIRTFSAGVSYDWADRKGGRSIAHLGIAKGVAGLGATPWFNPLASRIFATPATTTLSARLYSERPTGPVNLRINLEGEATLAGAKLAPVECAYGGQHAGQAYFPGAIGGDHCLLGSIEASRTFELNGGARLTTYAFGDFGLMRQRGGLDVGELRHEEGASLGIGLRGSLPNNLTISASLAKPLISSMTNPDRGLRLFGSIGMTL